MRLLSFFGGMAMILTVPATLNAESAHFSATAMKPQGPRAVMPHQEDRWMKRIIEAASENDRTSERAGAVKVSVSVSNHGRVFRCYVAQSSGHSSLDMAACRGMQRYARFHPAIDADGNIISSTFTTQIVFPGKEKMT